MSNKASRFLRNTLISGAALTATYAFTGSIFVENMLGKKGIRNLIAQGGLMPNEETDCFYRSEEALKGIEFFRTYTYKKLFVFNKFAEYHNIYLKKIKKSIILISLNK